MTSPVLLDAGVVNRCRRRVHLDNDPAMAGVPKPPPDPTAEQRMADAAAHRAALVQRIAEHAPGLVAVPLDGSAEARRQLTVNAITDAAPYIVNPLLPADTAGGRRGRIDLLVHAGDGYLPVLIVRHRITDPGSGALTSSWLPPVPAEAAADPVRKPRSQPGDTLRLAHVRRMLQACGAATESTLAGLIGLDADVALWHDLGAPNWPGGHSTLAEYDARFADRIAVATAALTGAPALARPSRVLECRRCEWWSTTCEAELTRTSDVSLVLRGEDAVTLRAAGIHTVSQLAALDPAAEPPAAMLGLQYADAVVLARAWLAGQPIVRRVRRVQVPRADVELDVDMESFSDSGAYLWGCLLSGPGVDSAIGLDRGYRAFATWEPVPCADEARSFAEFWAWLTMLRERAAAAGRTFRAYCYNELAENRWLLASAERFAGRPGIPTRDEVREFIGSEHWVDLYQVVSEQLLCARGKGLKVVAPAAGFTWRDPEAGGENSMRWYRDAVGMDGAPPDDGQRERLLAYNEDDVRATRALREWFTSGVEKLPHVTDL